MLQGINGACVVLEDLAEQGLQLPNPLSLQVRLLAFVRQKPLHSLKLLAKVGNVVILLEIGEGQCIWQ